MLALRVAQVRPRMMIHRWRVSAYAAIVPMPPLEHVSVAKWKADINLNPIRAPPVRWEYDTFLESVSDYAIESAEIPQDQKYIHVWFKDGSQRDLLLPASYDHIGFLMQHNVKVRVTKTSGPSAFSIVDIMLLTVQAIVLSRFVFIDANKKKGDADAFTKSGQIITSMFIDESTADVKESLTNKLLMSMSGTIAQDLVSGVIRNTTGTNGDLVPIARMTYELIASYGIIDLQTTEQIDRFIKACYKRSRNIIKRNFIYVCRLKEYILTYDKTPSPAYIVDLVGGISCKLKKNKM